MVVRKSWPAGSCTRRVLLIQPGLLGGGRGRRLRLAEEHLILVALAWSHFSRSIRGEAFVHQSGHARFLRSIRSRCAIRLQLLLIGQV